MLWMMVPKHRVQLMMWCIDGHKEAPRSARSSDAGVGKMGRSRETGDPHPGSKVARCAAHEAVCTGHREYRSPACRRKITPAADVDHTDVAGVRHIPDGGGIEQHRKIWCQKP